MQHVVLADHSDLVSSLVARSAFPVCVCCVCVCVLCVCVLCVCVCAVCVCCVCVCAVYV